MTGLRRAVLAVALAVGLLRPASGEEFALARPEDEGFSSSRLGRIVTTLKDDVAKGTIPGATVVIVRDGKIVLFETVGFLDKAAGAPLPREAIFRLYSMSKPITSVAAMILVEQGRLNLLDPVSKYIPAFADVKVAVSTTGTEEVELVPPVRPVTVQDLMRHTSGLVYGFLSGTPVTKMYREANLFSAATTNARFADAVARLPLAAQPGTAFNYSYSTDVLGRVIEVVSGQSLYQFEKENILDPLAMSDTGFAVPAAKANLIAEPLATDNKVVGTEPMSDPRLPATWEAGGQGMVSTAMDYARFLQMLQNGGTFGGHRILSPATVAFMTSDHLGAIGPGATLYLPGPGYGFGLGFAVRRTDGVSPVEGSAGDYFWSGAGGTSFWNDPRQRLTVVFMTQAPSQLFHYWAVMRNMVYGALEERK
jgi:CubicO group peptidase (beta-lactamase class C family)